VRRQLKLVLSVSADDISANQLRREHYPGQRRKIAVANPKTRSCESLSKLQQRGRCYKYFHRFAPVTSAPGAAIARGLAACQFPYSHASRGASCTAAWTKSILGPIAALRSPNQDQFVFFGVVAILTWPATLRR
jgi:hypothetical protein